jgi:hypothetical protein
VGVSPTSLRNSPLRAMTECCLLFTVHCFSGADDELALLHDLLFVHPDIEFPAHDVDVR